MALLLLGPVGCRGPSESPREQPLPPPVEKPVVEPPAAPQTDHNAEAGTTEARPPEPTTPPSPADEVGPCPPGMALVDGGAITAKQRARWQKHYFSHSDRWEAKDLAEVPAFCLDVLEATEADAARCGDGCQALTSKPLKCRDRGDCGALPLGDVTASGAAAFCAAQGKRLPTLVEWFWAAGGGAEDRKYPWGNGAPTAKLLNGCDFACARVRMSDCDESDRCTERSLSRVKGDDGHAGAAPVGSFPAGAGRWGHLDLAGNVMELTFGPVGDDVWWCGIDFGGTRSASLHEYQCVFSAPTDGVAGLRCAKDARAADAP